jgi:hypothetical protein
MTCHLSPAVPRLGLVSMLVGTVVAAGCSPPVRASMASEHVSQSSPIEKTFQSGGRVYMRLSAGEYLIEPRRDDKLVVAWEVRDPSDARYAKAGIGIEGSDARIETDGPNNGFDVKIGVPARSDLFVKLTAGELTVKGVEGHKDLKALAGEIRIAVDDSAVYRSVDAAVMAGEIQARAFGGHKGGLFRAFEWKGDGKYDLKARLTAGEIHLR